MTREEIMSLQGRKPDEAVAERVLCQPGKPVPPYSTSIAAAWVTPPRACARPLQMPMSAVLIAEVLQGVAYVYPHASMVALHCSGTHCDDA